MPAVLVDREADLAALARRAAVLAALGFLWLGIPVDAFAADASADADETAVVAEEASSEGTATEGSTDSTATETATEPVADDASAESPAAEPTPVPEPPPAESPPASEPAPAPEPVPVLDSSPAPEPAPPAPEAPPPEPVPPATSGTPSPPGPPAAQAPSIVLLPESPPPVSEIVQGLAPPLVQLAGDPRTGSRARQGGDSGIPLREAEQPSKVAPLPLAGDNGHAPVPGSFGGATGGASGAPSAGLDIALTFLVALALLGSGGLLLPLVAQLRPFALVSQLNRPG